MRFDVLPMFRTDFLRPLLRSTHRPLFRPHGQAPPSKLRIRIRLPAAIVNWNACSTLCSPRHTVCLRPPITLPQPKRSSTSLRLFWLTAYPACRVVRSSIALRRCSVMFCATCGVTSCSRQAATKSAVS